MSCNRGGFGGAIGGVIGGSNAAIVVPSRRGIGARARAVQSDPGRPPWDSDARKENKAFELVMAPKERR